MCQNEQTKLLANFLEIIETPPSRLGFKCEEGEDFISTQKLVDLLEGVLSDDYTFIFNGTKEKFRISEYDIYVQLHNMEE